MGDFTSKDREKLAATSQALTDLKENMPLLLEVSAQRGAEIVLERTSPKIEELEDKVEAVELAQAKMSSTMATLKWVSSVMVALVAVGVAFMNKIFGWIGLGE